VSQHSEKFIDETIEFWDPRFGRHLSREDAGQIIDNLSGFFKLLAEWDAAARQTAPKPNRSDIGEPTSK
jgi:hypothetical protein